MTLKLTAEFIEKNREAVALELEHIAFLIRDGYPKGNGWQVEESEEKLPEIQFEAEEKLTENNE